MAFHTFRHPDFASKHRNFRVVTQDDPKSPKADFVAAQTIDSEGGLRQVFCMSDQEWSETQGLLVNQKFFVFSLGGVMPVGHSRIVTPCTTGGNFGPPVETRHDGG